LGWEKIQKTPEEREGKKKERKNQLPRRGRRAFSEAIKNGRTEIDQEYQDQVQTNFIANEERKDSGQEKFLREWRSRARKRGRREKKEGISAAGWDIFGRHQKLKQQQSIRRGSNERREERKKKKNPRFRGRVWQTRERKSCGKKGKAMPAG